MLRRPCRPGPSDLGPHPCHPAIKQRSMTGSKSAPQCIRQLSGRVRHVAVLGDFQAAIVAARRSPDTALTKLFLALSLARVDRDADSEEVVRMLRRDHPTSIRGGGASSPGCSTPPLRLPSSRAFRASSSWPDPAEPRRQDSAGRNQRMIVEIIGARRHSRAVRLTAGDGR